MLSAETDVLTLLVDKVHPTAQMSTLQRMRDTVDVVIIMPFAGAARNAIVTELTYVALSACFDELPFRHLAALGMRLLGAMPPARRCNAAAMLLARRCNAAAELLSSRCNAAAKHRTAATPL